MKNKKGFTLVELIIVIAIIAIIAAIAVPKFTGIQAGYTMEIENAEVNGQGIGITVPSISTALYISAGNAYKPGGGTWLSTSDERL